MSTEPVLLFLHGVGDGDPEDEWRAALSKSLGRLGYPDLESARIIAPKVPNALKYPNDDGRSLPGITHKSPTGDVARQNRRDFERRTAAIENRFGRHEAGKGVVGADVYASAAQLHPGLAAAKNYASNPKIRAQVLNRILDELPTSGEIVIIGHSLGSVIAADLLRRLPLGLSIVGMVTIGSPLAGASFDVDRLRDTLAEPPINLGWWANFWNPADPVAALRGASSAVPWLLDVGIRTKSVGINAHRATDYLTNDVVAEAIGFALFGSTSRAVAVIDKGVEIPLNIAETYALLGLRYAYLLKETLDGDLHVKFAGALRQVHATTVESIRQQNEADGRLMPSAVLRLAFDVSDPAATAPEPAPLVHLSTEDAIVPLTVIAGANVIRPFDISIPKEKFRQQALENLTREMGLGSPVGTNVFAAGKLARKVLNPGPELNFFKLGAIGIGAAAIVFATGGLVLAAGAGLAGAAAVTSALAAFGPGGMIGGLLTAGTLVSAGGGGIAYGLASPGTSAETLEEIVVQQLTVAILRKERRLDQDPTTWTTLVETEIIVRRAYERLDEFSTNLLPPSRTSNKRSRLSNARWTT